MFRKLLICTLMLFALPAGINAETGPRISIEKLRNDVGEVFHGASATGVFTISNSGDEPLIISKLRSSCGCVSVVQGSKIIQPGATRSVEAEVNTRGLRAGSHRKSVFVHCNDPRQPITRLRLSFQVVRHIAVEPSSVAMTLEEERAGAQFSLRATNYTGKPITIRVAPSDEADAKVAITPEQVVVPPDGECDFKMSVPVRLDDSKSRCRGVARLLTDDPAEKELSVRYYVRLRARQGK
ncbi:DUF1573 domain-containing protein [Thermodesulfobacteriota bacterium]